jgi:phosphoglycolate phosphatase
LHRDDLSLFDGVLPLLRALRERHHWLAVATGKSRRGLDEALHAVELQGVFDGSRTADETAGKPDPRMLHELIREFGVEPERTLMIGDTTHDLQMARNAGCASVGVSYGAHEPGSFHALEPRHVAHSVRELHEWLIEHA